MTEQKTLLPPINVFFGVIWAQFVKRYPLLLSLAFLANLSAFISPIIDVSFPADSAAYLVTLMVTSIPLLVLVVWGNLALFASVALPEKTPTWRDAFRVGGPFFLDSLTTGILYGLIVLGGSLLLIIPGVYWGTLFCLASFLVMKEGLKNRVALKRSRDLIKGYWLDVFWRGIVFIITIIAVSFVPGFLFGWLSVSLPANMATFFENILAAIVTIVIAPLGIIALNVLYEQLTAIRRPAN